VLVLLIIVEQHQRHLEMQVRLYLEMLETCLLLKQLYLALLLNQQRHLEQLPLALQAVVPSVQLLRLRLRLLLLKRRRKQHQHQNLSVLRREKRAAAVVARADPENSTVAAGVIRKQERIASK
jgi:hypothetical protein